MTICLDRVYEIMDGVIQTYIFLYSILLDAFTWNYTLSIFQCTTFRVFWYHGVHAAWFTCSGYFVTNFKSRSQNQFSMKTTIEFMNSTCFYILLENKRLSGLLLLFQHIQWSSLSIEIIYIKPTGILSKFNKFWLYG